MPAAPPPAAAVLDAMGDATRRAILEQLAGGPLAVGVLAGRLPVSRPAVSQHLRVLRHAGLVTETVDGTRRLYRVDPRGLAAVRDYLDRFWTTALDGFAALAAADAAAAPPTSTDADAAAHADAARPADPARPATRNTTTTTTRRDQQ